MQNASGPNAAIEWQQPSTPTRVPFPTRGNPLDRFIVGVDALCQVSVVDISTADAARILNVTSDEVRRLLRAGSIIGRQLSGVWLVDADDIHRRRLLDASPGRVWTPTVAFAAVLLLAGRTDTGLSDSETSRLRRALREGNPADVIRRSRQLITVERWRVPAAGTKWLLAERGVFTTGESAIHPISNDLIDKPTTAKTNPVVHIGVATQDETRLRAGAKARNATVSANVIAHLVAAPHIDALTDENVQAVLTALILGTNPDARIRHAAETYLDERLDPLRHRTRG